MSHCSDFTSTTFRSLRIEMLPTRWSIKHYWNVGTPLNLSDGFSRIAQLPASEWTLSRLNWEWYYWWHWRKLFSESSYIPRSCRLSCSIHHSDILAAHFTKYLDLQYSDDRKFPGVRWFFSGNWPMEAATHDKTVACHKFMDIEWTLIGKYNSDLTAVLGCWLCRSFKGNIICGKQERANVPNLPWKNVMFESTETSY